MPEQDTDAAYVMRRPITTGDQMHEEGEAWANYHAGLGPKPVPDGEIKSYVVTLHNGDFVWRYEVLALNKDLARFSFIQKHAGMMISYDVRPSELDVEETAKFLDGKS